MSILPCSHHLQALEEGLKEQRSRTESLEKKLLRQISGSMDASDPLKGRCSTVSENTLASYKWVLSSHLTYKPNDNK